MNKIEDLIFKKQVIKENNFNKVLNLIMYNQVQFHNKILYKRYNN